MLGWALDDRYIGVVRDLVSHMVEHVRFEPGISVDIGSPCRPRLGDVARHQLRIS